ncbi:MAG: hypothetical protein IVW54_21650 [Candidatus Binataceae bacterium]|nr:hypothetical protein [Candidatus Binataceae bacterium]
MAVFAVLIAYLLINVSPITVADSHLEHEGHAVFITGELKNTSNRPSTIQLEVHYFDPSGRAIGENQINVPAIAAGAVREFRTPAIPLENVANFSLHLNHGRNPYGN